MANEPVPVFPVWRTTRFTPSDSLCFVLMPFEDPEVRKIYENIVEPQVRAHGLTAKTADDYHGSDVMEDIWLRINEARLIVADLTGRNPNVMYEVGIAHTVGTPILLLSARSDQKIPFDVNRFRHILYKRTTEGLEDLRRRLSGGIEDALKAHPSGSRLVTELEAAAKHWEHHLQDPFAPGPPELVARVRDHVSEESLSDLAVAFCAVVGAKYGSADQMIFWGRHCARRRGAARKLASATHNTERRPRLRVARILEQLPDETREAALARMVEHRADPVLIEAIRHQRVGVYVREHYAALKLTEVERDVLLEELPKVQL